MQSQESIENIKLDMMFPTSSGLGIAKTTANDASTVLGLYSPFKYGKKEYEGYRIDKLKDYCRFMLVMEDRDYGAAGNICPLFFNGASSFFDELPRPDDTQSMNAVYKYIEDLERKKVNKVLFRKVKYLFKIQK